VQDDIENLISNGKIDEVKQRIDSYKKLSEDHTQAAYRRAGLVGLSAIGIGLYQKNVSFHCHRYKCERKNTNFLMI
jgi:hypothetical protein